MPQLEVVFPDINQTPDQHEEYFILKGEPDERINFHDYSRIFSIPGLYEKVFYEELKCKSPTVIKEMLCEAVAENEIETEDLRILDFGAGNGLVGERFRSENPEMIVGVDILEEAKEAALRDRPDLYEEFLVTDLSTPNPVVVDKLQSYDLNTIVSVAALGFEDIPPDGFINAFNIIEDDGWVAFNIRDKFLTNSDQSGFRETLDWITDDFVDFIEEKTYVHRLTMTGEPIHYTGIVGKKLQDIPVPQAKP